LQIKPREASETHITRRWQNDAERRDADLEFKIKQREASASDAIRCWQTEAERLDDDS
jgi:hypothetical protein